MQPGRKPEFAFEHAPSILLRSMDHRMIPALQNLFAAAKETYGMRPGGREFGGKYLEDAFVYRIR